MVLVAREVLVASEMVLVAREVLVASKPIIIIIIIKFK